MNIEKSDSPNLERLREEIHDLNERLSRVEKVLGNPNLNEFLRHNNSIESQGTDFEIKLPFQSEGAIEFRVGEYGMAWLGNIILLFGIIFLVQNLQKSGNLFSTILAGYASVAVIYLGAHYTSKSYSYLSKLLSYNGHLILFYLTLRLHFFQDNPIIKNTPLALLLIILIVGTIFIIAIRKESQFMAGLALLMSLITGVVSNSTFFLLGTTTIVSLISVTVYNRYGWTKVVFVFISLVYFIHLNWLLNNPFISGEAVLRTSHEFGLVYLTISGLIFSMLAIIRKKENISDEVLVAAIIWNGIGFSFVLIVSIIAFFQNNYVLIFGAISIFCLVYSVILKTRSSLKIAAPIYAIYGFMTMSISIYGIFLLPKAYMLLSVQSFLVVSMALWFRSRFLVFMNTILFILLMIFYLKDPVSYNRANFSFMLVAFITARVMNWKKERLNLKTEFIRNLYLISGFIMTLIALHHAVPGSYVTVSWIVAAILFFILGHLIKNIKYRWLAIAAMIASAVNLVFIDLKSMNISLRILVFLILAIILLTTSIVYTKFLKKRTE